VASDSVSRRAVKIRGYRVELGEVEAVLAQHPAVDEAVVVARGDDGDRELTAYVVTEMAKPLVEDELRRYLEEKLPRHMQPGAIAQLERLPRLATGKPDRRRLPGVERRANRGRNVPGAAAADPAAAGPDLGGAAGA
jgi:acyl-coenzyme A synthetase/AMP-(fatty) acid ligase